LTILLFYKLLFIPLLFTLGLIAIKIVKSIILKTKNPLLVVMSYSMGPALKPGDLLIVDGSDSIDPKTGDIVAFRQRESGDLVIHRVFKIEDSDGEKMIFTKGDALMYLDDGYLRPTEIVGIVRWRIPKLAIIPYIFWLLIKKFQ
jgi:signal peptidase I